MTPLWWPVPLMSVRCAAACPPCGGVWGERRHLGRGKFVPDSSRCLQCAGSDHLIASTSSCLSFAAHSSVWERLSPGASWRIGAAPGVATGAAAAGAAAAGVAAVGAAAGAAAAGASRAPRGAEAAGRGAVLEARAALLRRLIRRVVAALAAACPLSAAAAAIRRCRRARATAQGPWGPKPTHRPSPARSILVFFFIFLFLSLGDLLPKCQKFFFFLWASCCRFVRSKCFEIHKTSKAQGEFRTSPKQHRTLRSAVTK